jgi:hypothetical protein
MIFQETPRRLGPSNPAFLRKQETRFEKGRRDLSIVERILGLIRRYRKPYSPKFALYIAIKILNQPNLFGTFGLTPHCVLRRNHQMHFVRRETKSESRWSDLN